MTGHNLTDRSKLGSKRHILTDKEGIPLSTIITSANTQDVTVATKTIDNIVIKRLTSYKSIKCSKQRKKQNLCLDKAYHSIEVEQEIIKRGYIPHIRHRREEKIFHKQYRTRR
jgi:IS5 family transposase